MNLGVTNIKEWIELIAVMVGASSIFFVAVSYRQANKKFRFDVMVSCIERFQIIFPDLVSGDKDKKNRALIQYIDLCNEELFYFKHKYVPDEVVLEWLDGMISILPLYNAEGELIATGMYPEIEEMGLLRNTPRIRKAFRLPKMYDLSKSSERMEAISAIRKNLAHLSYPCA
jgi:hypothetical protein